jgi:predicted PurR-regulated permease PerM
VEYLPIPIYPEIYSIYLIVVIALVAIAAIVLYLLKFSRHIHARFSKILESISDLKNEQKKLSEEIKAIREDLKSEITKEIGRELLASLKNIKSEIIKISKNKSREE